MYGYWDRVGAELEMLRVSPYSVAKALAELARVQEVHDEVARNNAEADKRAEERLAAGCPVHGVTQYWIDDGYGGICDLCDRDAR